MSMRDLHGPLERGVLHLGGEVHAARLRGRHEERAAFLAAINPLIARLVDADDALSLADFRGELARMSIAASARHAEDCSGVPLGAEWPGPDTAPVIIRKP